MRAIRALVLILASATIVAAQEGSGTDPEADSDVWTEIRTLYEKAKETGEQVPGDVVAWLKQDLDRIGDWEYRLLVVSSLSNDKLEAKLNELGTDRWECFAVLHDDGTIRLFLKRPVKSYLRHVPITDLWKLVPSGGDDTEE